MVRLAAAWGRLVVRRRGLVSALLALLTVAIAAAAAARVARDGVPLDFTPQAIFMDAGPEFDRLARIEAEFGKDDNDLLLLVDGDLESEAGVAYLRALHAAAESTPGVERVDSVVTATVLEGGDGLLTVVTPLDERPREDAFDILATDPVLGGMMLSADHRTTAVRVRIDTALARVAALAPPIHAVVAAAEAVPRPDGVRLLPTGVPYVRVEVVELMASSQLTYLPLVAALFLGTLTLMMRRLGPALAPLVTVLLADVWALGALVAGGVTFNVLSVLVPTLVVVIGVADGIHIVGRWREELGRGASRADAMAGTLQAMLLPCFLTTFTTAAGFVSLLVAETSVIRSFGLQAAVAMLVTFVAVMALLPTLLAWLPAERLGARHEASALEGRLLGGIDALVARRPLPVLGVTALLTVAAAAYGSAVGTNSGLLEMYREGMATHEAITLSEAQLAGVVPVMFHFEGAPDQLVDPDVLARIDRIEAATRAEAPVRWTSSPASAVRTLHGALTGADGLPADRELVAQELLLAEMSGDRSLEAVLSPDRAQARITALMTDAGGRVYLPLRAKLLALAEAELAGTGVSVALTGDGFLAASGVDRLIGDLLSSVGLIFVIITVVFALVLRDLRLALLATVPNLVPLVFTLATLRGMGVDLQTSNVVSFTVAVGLAVDDTIHFLVRYRQERGAGHGVAAATRRTLLGAGHAIIVTSVLLVVGFGVLATDDLTSTRHFGVLSSVTMVAALLGDLFLLPALLHLVEKDR